MNVVEIIDERMKSLVEFTGNRSLRFLSINDVIMDVARNAYLQGFADAVNAGVKHDH